MAHAQLLCRSSAQLLLELLHGHSSSTLAWPPPRCIVSAKSKSIHAPVAASTTAAQVELPQGCLAVRLTWSLRGSHCRNIAAKRGAIVGHAARPLDRCSTETNKPINAIPSVRKRIMPAFCGHGKVAAKMTSPSYHLKKCRAAVPEMAWPSINSRRQTCPATTPGYRDLPGKHHARAGVATWHQTGARMR